MKIFFVLCSLLTVISLVLAVCLLLVTIWTDYDVLSHEYIVLDKIFMTTITVGIVSAALSGVALAFIDVGCLVKKEQK